MDEWFRATVTPVSDGIAVATQIITERKQAEEALKESEARFRVAVMNPNIVLSQFDLDLKYTWLHNPHPDFDVSQMIGKHGRDIEDSKAMQLLDNLKLQVVENAKSFREEITFDPSDGAHTYDMIIEPIYDNAGAVIGGTICAFDITDRKKAQEALRVSEARFRSVLESSRDLIYLLNLQTGCYEYISPSAEAVVGLFSG